MAKKSILRPLSGAALVAAAALLASCSDVYTGGDADSTSVSFSSVEANVTKTANATGSFAGATTVSVSSTTISTAATDSTVTLQFSAKTRLDEDSIKAAVSFYTLAENKITVGTSTVYAYPTRTAISDSELLAYGESSVSSGSVTGTALFRVNTASVTNGKIAVVVDAAKLKDEKGNKVLNGDDNETAGEESDSFIDYITVSAKADGSTPDMINYTKEDFAPAYMDLSASMNDAEDSNGKQTGAYAVTVSAYDSDASALASDGKSVYKSGLESTLAGMYAVQVKKAGESAWTDKALSFTYVKETRNAGTAWESVSYSYVATTDVLTPGDKIRLVTKNLTKDALSDATNAAKLYGHTAYVSYKAKSYTSYGKSDGTDLFTQTFFATEPTYIVQNLNATGNFVATDYSASTITTAQQAAFNVKKVEDGYYLFTLKKVNYSDATTGDAKEYQPTFASYNDFLAVSEANSSYVTLDATVTKLTDSIVKLELKNQNFTGAVSLYVGSGVTLSSNVLHPTQKTFGTYKDVSKGAVSGYVKLQ